MSRGSRRARIPTGTSVDRLRQQLVDDRQQQHTRRCPNTDNKVIYPTEEDARHALATLRLRLTTTTPVRPERVEQCGAHWHLMGGERAKCPITGTSIYMDQVDAQRGLAAAQQRDNPPQTIAVCGGHFHIVSPQRPRCAHNNRVIFRSYESAAEALKRITNATNGPDIKPTRVEPCPFGEPHFHLARRPRPSVNPAPREEPQ